MITEHCSEMREIVSSAVLCEIMSMLSSVDLDKEKHYTEIELQSEFEAICENLTNETFELVKFDKN